MKWREGEGAGYVDIGYEMEGEGEGAGYMDIGYEMEKGRGYWIYGYWI